MIGLRYESLLRRMRQKPEMAQACRFERSKRGFPQSGLINKHSTAAHYCAPMMVFFQENLLAGPACHRFYGRDSDITTRGILMWIERAKLDIISVIHTPSSQMSEASTQTWTMRSPRAADDDSRMICPSRCIFSRSVARSLGLLSRSYTVCICGIECRPGLLVLPHTEQGTPGRSDERMLG